MVSAAPPSRQRRRSAEARTNPRPCLCVQDGYAVNPEDPPQSRPCRHRWPHWRTRWRRCWVRRWSLCSCRSVQAHSSTDERVRPPSNEGAGRAARGRCRLAPPAEQQIAQRGLVLLLRPGSGRITRRRSACSRGTRLRVTLTLDPFPVHQNSRRSPALRQTHTVRAVLADRTSKRTICTKRLAENLRVGTKSVVLCWRQ